jgi:peptidoglycan/xylan/chitin deacetylase (PgdA/CDA1 family)
MQLSMGSRPPRRALATLALLSLAACGHACGPGVPIVMYHTVSDLPEGFALAENDFVGHLDYLKAAGFNTVTLHEVFEHEDRGAPLPAKPVVLTFDDGYADNYSRVLPLLQSRGMKATFFVVSRFLAEDEEHRRVEEKGTPQEKRFLLWSEVRALAAAGMEIGSHSLFHRRLTTLSLEEARADVRSSREELEAGLGRPVEFLAYPYNSARRPLRQAVASVGYRGAVSGHHPLGDRYEMNRISVFRGMPAAELRDKLDTSWLY